MLTFYSEQYTCALFTNPQISFFINFFIKNGSHNTIHTFKNYFATVFSVFSFQFQQNKFYPYTPIKGKTKGFLSHSPKKKKNWRLTQKKKKKKRGRLAQLHTTPDATSHQQSAADRPVPDSPNLVIYIQSLVFFWMKILYPSLSPSHIWISHACLIKLWIEFEERQSL